MPLSIARGENYIIKQEPIPICPFVRGPRKGKSQQTSADLLPNNWKWTVNGREKLFPSYCGTWEEMQNTDGFDNLAASIGVEETSLEDLSSKSCSNSEETNMSHARSSTKTSNYDYHRRKALSIISIFLWVFSMMSRSTDDRQVGGRVGWSPRQVVCYPNDVCRETEHCSQTVQLIQ